MIRKRVSGWLALLICMVLILSLAACAGGSGKSSSKSTEPAQSADSSKKLEPVTLKIMMPGDRPKDMDKVLAEAERRLANTLNVKLDIVFIPWADLAQKTQIALASGEEVDVIFDAPWVHMDQMIAQGFYEPLENLLEKYGPNLLATRSQEIWDANKFGGKIMGIPLGDAVGAGWGYGVRKDIREKLGFPEIKTYDDLVKFMYAVKEKEPDLIPFNSTGNDSSWGEAQVRTLFDYENNVQRTFVAGNSLMLYFKNNDGKVYNFLETKDSIIWEKILNTRKMYQDKIINPDVMAVKDHYELLKSGKAAVVPINEFGVQATYVDALKGNLPNADLEYVTFYNFEPKKNLSDFKYWNFACIPVASKNKERAIQFLNWANEKANYDLLAYGIEGTNWEAVGDDQYKDLGGYGYFPYGWIMNPVLERLGANIGQEINTMRSFLRKSDNFQKNVLVGFSFDSTPVSNEIALLSTIETKYYSPMIHGALDPEEAFKNLKKEGDSIIKRIQTEVQKQIDVFMDSKK